MPTLQEELASFARIIAQTERDQRPAVFRRLASEGIRLHTVGHHPESEVLDGLRTVGLNGGLSENEVEAALVDALRRPFNPKATNPIGLPAEADEAPPTPRRREKSDLMPARPEIVCVADVEPRPVEWLWRGRLAKGKLSIIAGDPGLGKTQVALDIAARISANAGWPDGGTAPSGSVMILSAEDGVADTIRPRLELAGADLRRIQVLKSMLGPDGERRLFNLQADLATLGQKLADMSDVGLVIIDPITAYMGMVDSHRTTDVRAVLDPLATFAETAGVAVLAITHPPKAAQAKAIHAFTGSLAFVAAARMAFVVVEEEGTDRVLLLHAKNNLASPPEGLAFRKTEDATIGGITASHIVWDSVPVTVTADEALHASAQVGKNGSALSAAVEFLRDQLAGGAVAAEDVKKAAEAEGIKGATLRRARERLGVTIEKAEFQGASHWRQAA